MHLRSTAAVEELLGQVLEEPRVHADARNGDAVARVGLKDLADEVHALPRQVQVAGEAVLHAHDALHTPQHGQHALQMAFWPTARSISQDAAGASPL